MKNKIKTTLKRFINLLVTLFEKNPVGRHFYTQVINNAMSRTQKVEHNKITLLFSVPNPQSKFRVDTFSTKEPETLEWIDGLEKGSVLWDIGANIGLYSCYAAKQRGCKVFAFEPSVFNLELLSRNIFVNQLTNQITIVPLPLSDKLSANKLNMTETDWGGAMSTFGQTYGHDGQPMRKVFELPTIGLSMVDAVELLKIPQPDFIKMDVDGIEHLILKGGKPILLKAKSVLIEINDKFAIQANEADAYLKEVGFSLHKKKHADYFDFVTSAAKHTFNQIWIKEIDVNLS